MNAIETTIFKIWLIEETEEDKSLKAGQPFGREKKLLQTNLSLTPPNLEKKLQI